MLLSAPSALGACSEGGGARDTTAAATTDDPCSLLSAGAVQRATGWPVAAQDDAAAVAGPTCEWVDEDRPDRVVQVRLDDGGTAAYDEARDAADTRLRTTTDTEVAGAARAFEVRDQGVVVALVGGRVLQVAVSGPDAPQDAGPALAATAVRRLADPGADR